MCLVPIIRFLSFSEESYVPFYHSLMLDLLLETLLGFKTGIEQGGSVYIPLTDAFEVFCAVLIINDEWHDLVAQTLFEHE